MPEEKPRLRKDPRGSSITASPNSPARYVQTSTGGLRASCDTYSPQNLRHVPSSRDTSSSSTSVSKAPLSAGLQTTSYMDLYRPSTRKAAGEDYPYRNPNPSSTSYTTSTATSTSAPSTSSTSFPLDSSNSRLPNPSAPRFRTGSTFKQSPLTQSNLSRMTPGSSSSTTGPSNTDSWTASSTNSETASETVIGSEGTSLLYGLRWETPAQYGAAKQSRSTAVTGPRPAGESTSRPVEKETRSSPKPGPLFTSRQKLLSSATSHPSSQRSSPTPAKAVNKDDLKPLTTANLRALERDSPPKKIEGFTKPQVEHPLEKVTKQQEKETEDKEDKPRVPRMLLWIAGMSPEVYLAKMEKKRQRELEKGN